MNHTELTIKATITDIEPKTDKNSNPYFKISLQGLFNQAFYAFSFNLDQSTLNTLTQTPYYFINRLCLISYSEQNNKDNQGTFAKVKKIELVH